MDRGKRWIGLGVFGIVAALWLGAAPAAAVSKCKVKVDKKTGALLVSARDVSSNPLWGGEPDLVGTSFANPVDCFAGGKLKGCRLGPPGSLDETTPPASCTVFLADDGPDACFARVPNCTVGIRPVVIGSSDGALLWLANLAGSAATLYGTGGFPTLDVRNTSGVPASPAGLFVGDVDVNGTLTKSAGSFRIDHPLDPANKYLAHSFVESPDMLNVYNGNVVLGADGRAVVELPEWFEALNREFRYQLTAVGGPGPELHVAERIAGNRFSIAGGKPGLEVSWQVTGVRQDAYANAHRITVEERKPEALAGTYLHPELFGAGPERQQDLVKR